MALNKHKKGKVEHRNRKKGDTRAGAPRTATIKDTNKRKVQQMFRKQQGRMQVGIEREIAKRMPSNEKDALKIVKASGGSGGSKKTVKQFRGKSKGGKRR